jgi:glycosyltransferase involved in cell wall biosynthesis
MNSVHPAEQSLSILQVTREWQADRKYGLGRSLAPILEVLAARGHRVQYLCQEDAGQGGLELMRILNPRIGRLLRRLGGATQWENLLWGMMERINMGRLAAKVAYRDGYTHVHLHDPFLAWGFRLFSCWRPRQVRWGITVHGFGSYAQAFHEDGALLGTRAMRWLRRLESRMVEKGDWVIFPTAAAMHQLQRDLGLFPLPDRWRVIHHARSQPSLLSREQARATLGWDLDGVYAVAVGRIVWIKHFLLAVRACATAGSERLRLVIVGEGPHEDLLAAAEALDFGGRVQFAETDDVAPFYRAADIYISSSRSESFGMANLEAMVAGLPIISTAVGGVLEVLGGAAHWVPSDDEEAMRRAVQQLLEDKPSREGLADLALRRAGLWPDAEQVAEGYEKVYRHALV